MKTPLNIAATALLIGTSLHSIGHEHSLPDLQLDIAQITVSGLSSGGYMANQLHIAYSDWVSGVGMVAAGPYYCAQNSLLTALASCINKLETPIGFDAIEEQLNAWREANVISSTQHIKGDKVWLLSGTKDDRVIQEVVDGLASQYTQWGAELTYISDKPFAHHFPTENIGSQCDIAESPFIGKCNYDAAGEMLKYITPNIKDKGIAKTENLYKVNQVEFGGEHAKGLGENAYVYIPNTCKEGEECQLHVSFHGCNQFSDLVGDAYVTQTGINDWAENNHLVVLYPQTKASSIAPFNPQGCWDWWGYTDANYATQQGIQIQAVKAMIDHLAGEIK